MKVQTNLDLLCTILAEATGQPASRFRRSLCQAIEGGILPADGLLQPADPLLYQKLQSEKRGILARLVEAAN